MTRPREFFGALAQGLFIETQLDKDLEAVQFLYRRRGWLAAIVTREFLFTEDRSAVTIRVTMAEGVRTFVGSTTLAGQQAVPEAELRSHLTLRVGDPFDEVQAQDDVDRLLAVYERRGYRDAPLTSASRTTVNLWRGEARCAPPAWDS